ncbi:MAG TPA: arsenate reductase family protein [Candidatus Obscuribacterales bacterium]
MSDKMTVYQKPTCSTCREVDKILRESGADYDKIDYYVEPIGEQKLRELIQKMRVTPRDLLRTKEDIYRQLDLGNPKHSDDELIKLMAQYPDLLQRPIVEKGNMAVLARPAENIRRIL